MVAKVRKTVTVLLMLLGIDFFFVCLAMFGMYSIPGQISLFFFTPAIAIGDRLAPFLSLPRGFSPMADVFVIQFLLLVLVTFGVSALKKWVP